MNGSDTADTTAWSLEVSLCRRYHLALFRTADAPVFSSAGTQQQSIPWALGFLRDGDRELLGVWNRPSGASPFSADVFADLDRRGVEGIDFVVGPLLDDARFEVGALPLGAGALPSIEHELAAAVVLVARRDRVAAGRELRTIAAMRSLEAMLDALTRMEHEGWGKRYPQMIERWRVAISRWDVLFQLPAARRRAVGEADRIADDLQAVLVRAIGRHGCFATEADALRFVATSLTKAESRRWRNAHGAPVVTRSDRFGRHPRLVGRAPPRARSL